MGNAKVRSNSGGNENLAIGGHLKLGIKNCQGSSSYATGGDSLAAAAFGLTKIHCFMGSSVLTNSGTYRIEIIYPNENGVSTVKLFWRVVATGAEVANTTDLSAERFRLAAVGTQ